MDPQEWYNGLPIVTKTLFTSVLVTTLAGNFGLLSPYTLILNYPLIWGGFEIWRLVTCVFFFGKLGFPFLMNLYFLYNYSLNLERGLFERRTADYVWMIVSIWLTLLVVAYFMSLVMIGLPLVIAILYVWCNVNAEQIVSFWFGTKFKAMYLPWVLVGFNILMGGNGFSELLGIFAGHVYYFLKYKMPENGSPDYLQTPAFVRNIFPDEQGGFGTMGGTTFGQAPASRAAAAAADRRTFTGAGHRLGNQD
ncbi:uncharacterized protein MONBRDRAFT_37095 [Monosiga brevicollis MX1]|uniref:Derlin n=1 Tax=Monosiga brevicollis TaxID=81824 RepID=A9UZJ8_MONBE|nr:uncharacterized protein MONBRDRAFT_37095 [Monosiga brevicollis MX1]EDQ89381.1 predicted protein [Monosiga brevicollis MX1]|eukprot:XP_001745957.1 hypothetical protein [Monosiga brevicollis MX1]